MCTLYNVLEWVACISRIATPRTHIPEGIGNYTLYRNSSKSEETLKYATLKAFNHPLKITDYES